MKTTYVLLAGGKGNRLKPMTDNIPKCLVKIGGKPVLERILEKIYANALKIVIVVGVHAGKVKSFVKKTRFSKKVVFVTQAKQLGTGHAILRAQNQVNTSQFVVIYADQVFENSLYKKINSLCGKQFFLVAKKSSDVFGSGLVKAKNGFLQKIVEKPSKHSPGLINTSIVCVPKTIFKILKKVPFSPRGEIEATDAYSSLAERQKVKVIVFNGFWSDIGTKKDYLFADNWVRKNKEKM